MTHKSISFERQALYLRIKESRIEQLEANLRSKEARIEQLEANLRSKPIEIHEEDLQSKPIEIHEDLRSKEAYSRGKEVRAMLASFPVIPLTAPRVKFDQFIFEMNKTRAELVLKLAAV